jgi:prepilin-type processing-associated H-X9-DG protein
MRPRRPGLTLIELVLLAIVLLLLAGLLFKGIQRSRESSARLHCMANLQKIGTAFHEHEQAFGFFPDAGGRWTEGRALKPDGSPETAPRQTWGWAYQILPYVGQQETWANPDSSAVAATVIPIYYCPARRSPAPVPGGEAGVAAPLRGAIDYAGNGGDSLPMFPADGDALIPPATTDVNGAVVPRVNVVRIDSQHLPRGSSSTLLAGDRQANLKTLGTGKDADEKTGYVGAWSWNTIRWAFAPFAPDRQDDADFSREFGSSHPNGVNFLYADGGVRNLAYGMSLDVFRRLSDRNLGEAARP